MKSTVVWPIVMFSLGSSANRKLVSLVILDRFDSFWGGQLDPSQISELMGMSYVDRGSKEELG